MLFRSRPDDSDPVYDPGVILAIPLFFGHFMDKAEEYANDFGQQVQSHYSSGADSLPE